MKLFQENSQINLLPYDGEVYYHGAIVSQEVAQEYFGTLLRSVDWKADEGMLFGKRYVTKRKVAWYGDKGYNYGYSKDDKFALPWTEALLKIKQLVEQSCGYTFNSCLLNLYHSGAEGMGWHSDDEKELQIDAPIASLSLGAKRKFSFKHKENKDTKSIVLENGSLLIMEGKTQRHWLHCMPKTKRVQTARINLTYRQFA